MTDKDVVPHKEPLLALKLSATLFNILYGFFSALSLSFHVLDISKVCVKTSSRAIPFHLHWTFGRPMSH